MNKYIRTKNSVYEEKEAIGGIKYFEILMTNNSSYNLCRSDKTAWDYFVIKEADTIEKLCDEFVVHSEINNAHYTMSWFDLCEELQEDRFYPSDIIYGAIWTDNGLKYVAKLVDGGELELL